MEHLSRLDELVEIAPGKKVFFVSDFHLGVPNHDESLAREIRIVKWLEHIKNDASAIFLSVTSLISGLNTNGLYLRDSSDFRVSWQSSLMQAYQSFSSQVIMIFGTKTISERN